MSDKPTLAVLRRLHTWAIDNGPTITTEALLSEITRLSPPRVEAHEGTVRSAAVLEAQEALAWWDSGRRPMRTLSAETVRALLATVREQDAGRHRTLDECADECPTWYDGCNCPPREQDTGEMPAVDFAFENDLLEVFDDAGSTIASFRLPPLPAEDAAPGSPTGETCEGTKRVNVRPAPGTLKVYDVCPGCPDCAPTDSEGEDG